MTFIVPFVAPLPIGVRKNLTLIEPLTYDPPQADWIAAADVLKLSTVLLANRFTEVTQTPTIRASTTAYSTVVGPSSSRRNSTMESRIVVIFMIMVS
jgi:hypothetical protein